MLGHLPCRWAALPGLMLSKLSAGLIVPMAMLLVAIRLLSGRRNAAALDLRGEQAMEYDDFEQLRLARLCAYLRHREPDDQVGYSILIYRLSDRQVQQALLGPPAELLPDTPPARR